MYKLKQNYCYNLENGLIGISNSLQIFLYVRQCYEPEFNKFFSVNGQIIKHFKLCIASVTTTQPCLQSVKAATDNKDISK